MPATMPLEDTRRHYQLPLDLFAALVGLTPQTVARWESGRADLSGAVEGRVIRTAYLLYCLNRAMSKGFMRFWLITRNKHCQRLGVRIPLDLFAAERYEELEELIYAMKKAD